MKMKSIDRPEVWILHCSSGHPAKAEGWSGRKAESWLEDLYNFWPFLLSFIQIRVIINERKFVLRNEVKGQAYYKQFRIAEGYIDYAKKYIELRIWQRIIISGQRQHLLETEAWAGFLSTEFTICWWSVWNMSSRRPISCQNKMKIRKRKRDFLKQSSFRFDSMIGNPADLHRRIPCFAAKQIHPTTGTYKSTLLFSHNSWIRKGWVLSCIFKKHDIRILAFTKSITSQTFAIFVYDVSGNLQKKEETIRDWLLIFDNSRVHLNKDSTKYI